MLTGQGQGDLSKGKLVCQRVSELAARADIAKQIRVLVKEHATDRLREQLRRLEIETEAQIVARMSSEEKARHADLKTELAELNAQKPKPYPVAMAIGAKIAR